MNEKELNEYINQIWDQKTKEIEEVKEELLFTITPHLIFGPLGLVNGFWEVLKRITELSEKHSVSILSISFSELMRDLGISAEISEETLKKFIEKVKKQNQ